MGERTLVSVILGLLQGLTEFLPVSSSGHIKLAEALLPLAGLGGTGDFSGALTVLLHAGTLLAVLVVFLRDWLDMLRHPVKNRTLLYLFLASLPALFSKVFLGRFLDGLSSGLWLGIFFLLTALMLCLTQILGARGRHARRRTRVGALQALTMGLFQALALPPGISRSGSTLLGGAAAGLSRTAAFRFSFMMSAPAILGGLLSEARDLAGAEGAGALLTLLSDRDILIGMAVAALSGFAALRLMLRRIEKVSFYRFALYVALVGAAVLWLYFSGTAFQIGEALG